MMVVVVVVMIGNDNDNFRSCCGLILVLIGYWYWYWVLVLVVLTRRGIYRSMGVLIVGVSVPSTNRVREVHIHMRIGSRFY